MAQGQLPAKDYMIIASILKDGPGARYTFTFKELFEVLETMGFAQLSKGRWGYEGKALFVSKPGDKGRDAVSYARQDDMKRQMLALFGWDKGSFEEQIE